LATSVDKVPSGERWIHEIKFDGYRVQVHLKDAVVKVFTRRGNDWTNRFRKIAADAWHISAGSAIIDGEVVVPAAADGTTDFSVLQNELLRSLKGADLSQEQKRRQLEPPWLASVDCVGPSRPGILRRMHHELAGRDLYGRLFPRHHVTGAGAAKHNPVDAPTPRPKHH